MANKLFNGLMQLGHLVLQIYISKVQIVDHGHDHNQNGSVEVV